MVWGKRGCMFYMKVNRDCVLSMIKRADEVSCDWISPLGASSFPCVPDV